MKKTLLFIRLMMLTAAIVASASSEAFALTGAWRGSISFGQIKLPLVFNFSEVSPDSISCTFDSPAQKVKGIATDVTFYSADSIAIECKAIGAKYNANIQGDSICGKFIQRGVSLPLTLRQEESLLSRRPQTPQPPFPYTTVDTVFHSTGGIRIAGTLTLPDNTSATGIPAVVMVSGSGQQNRDEEILEHRPFAVIADHLARHGIASLRYDDRGTGLSSGNFISSTISDFADDAKNAAVFLKTIPQIGKIGILGHSEGGTISFMTASSFPVDFIVSLAGMAVTGKQTILQQNSRALERAGISGEAKDNSLKLIDRFFDVLIQQISSGAGHSVDVDSLVKEMDMEVPPQIVASLKGSQSANSSEFDSLLALDPAEFLEKVTCPVLAINGDKDTQVDALSNTDEIRRKIPHAEIHVMPGLNHLLQHCSTGEVSEYGEIRETISPETLRIITDFILKHNRH